MVTSVPEGVVYLVSCRGTPIRVFSTQEGAERFVMGRLSLPGVEPWIYVITPMQLDE